MIEPNATDIIRCVLHTFESVIKPELSSPGAKSAAATMSHLLRIVSQRIEVEGQVLADEAVRLNEFLPRLQIYLAGQADGGGVAAKVGAGLAASGRKPDVYPNLMLMAEEIKPLRQGICDGLDYLLAREERLDEKGAALLAELRAYVSWQLEQEARVIEPATVGRGPRR